MVSRTKDHHALFWSSNFRQILKLFRVFRQLLENIMKAELKSEQPPRCGISLWSLESIIGWDTIKTLLHIFTLYLCNSAPIVTYAALNHGIFTLFPAKLDGRMVNSVFDKSRDSHKADNQHQDRVMTDRNKSTFHCYIVLTILTRTWNSSQSWAFR